MKLRRTTYGPGGFISTQGDKNVISDVVTVVAGLGSDRATIPADGVTPATLHYAGREPSPHGWSVNGTVTNVASVLDTTSGLQASELEVTAAQVGPVEVIVNGATLTIQAV